MEAKKMMEIKIEGTMKLTDLLNEDVYVKNKETGNVYQVKIKSIQNTNHHLKVK